MKCIVSLNKITDFSELEVKWFMQTCYNGLLEDRQQRQLYLQSIFSQINTLGALITILTTYQSSLPLWSDRETALNSFSVYCFERGPLP